MIIVINTKGLTFRVPQKNIEVKTPARLKISEGILLTILSELRKQDINEWYILSDLTTRLKAPPKTMQSRSGKNKPSINNTNNDMDYSSKLDEIISLLKDIKNKETSTHIFSSPDFPPTPHTKKPKDKVEEFIPFIDISDMEIKSDGLQTQKQDVTNDNLNDAANAINDILSNK